MTPESQKQQEKKNKARWMVKVILVNNVETSFIVTTKDVRQHIIDSPDRTEQVNSSAGIINKYVFPLVFDRFKGKSFKSIKIRGNYNV